MTVSLPPREEDHSKASWFLEVTREINRLESLIASLNERIQELEDNNG